jgi:hypothetical protein
MREAWLRLLLGGLLTVAWIYHRLVWGPAEYVATRMSKQLDALELSLLVAGAERRTRNEREIK